MSSWVILTTPAATALFVSLLLFVVYVALQTLSLSNLSLKITIAALRSYKDKRATDGPQLLFVLALVLVLILFFSALGISIYLHAKERATAVVLLAKERAERDLADTARSAHEKTVAYACHQLL